MAPELLTPRHRQQQHNSGILFCPRLDRERFLNMGKPIKSVALAGLAALLAGNSGADATSSLNVFHPGAVVLGRAFALEWESVGQDRFDVILYPNSGSCGGSGEPLDLCGKANGCADSQGDLNVVVPAEAGVGERECPLVK